jgi:hypothetical protein
MENKQERVYVAQSVRTGRAAVRIPLAETIIFMLGKEIS